VMFLAFQRVHQSVVKVPKDQKRKKDRDDQRPKDRRIRNKFVQEIAQVHIKPVSCATLASCPGNVRHHDSLSLRERDGVRERPSSASPPRTPPAPPDNPRRRTRRIFPPVL